VIIDRYLFKEIIYSLLAVLTVLLLIFVSKHFVRYMSDAAAGELPAYLIFQLLSLFTLSYLVMIVPFALFLSVIITFGRLYKDSEITAAEACGLGIPRIMQSTFYLSLLIAVIVGTLSIWVAPWAEEQQYLIRDQAKSESELGFISAGRFHEIRKGNGVFYVERFSDDNKTMYNIFVHLQNGSKMDIFSAPTGYMELDRETGSQFIVLQNGYRYEELADNKGYRLHEYESSGVRIAQEAVVSNVQKIIAQPTSLLFKDDSSESKAELHWRIAMPISCVLLTLMAVLLSHTNPRQGRFAKLFIALLAYIAYVYLLMLTKSWLKNGNVPVELGMWWVHLMAAIFVFYLAANQFGWQWMRSQFSLRRAT